MKFKVGDIVQIKSAERVKATLSGSHSAESVNFNERMYKHTGKKFEVKEIRTVEPNGVDVPVYMFKDMNMWVWVEEWVESPITPIKLPEELFEI